MRSDGRAANELRPGRILPNYLDYPEGSALIEMGRTRVLCAVSIEATQPPHLLGTDQGWITAEYAMLPRATHTRTPRESVRGRPSGRTQEIQRLIGRALRITTDLHALGPRTCLVDCDVLQADGGTRTAAITGGYVALALALQRLVLSGELRESPLRTAVAAVSVGVVDGELLLDLCYDEDSRAGVDFNLVMTREGQLVEVQGTAESQPFTHQQMARLLDLGAAGIARLFSIQDEALRRAGIPRPV